MQFEAFLGPINPIFAHTAMPLIANRMACLELYGCLVFLSVHIAVHASTAPLTSLNNYSHFLAKQE